MLADLLGKMASGQPLSVLEQQEVVMEFRRMEELLAVLVQLVVPGSSALRAENISLGSGTVVVDGDGVSIEASDEYVDSNSYKFRDANGNLVGGLYAYVTDALSQMSIQAFGVYTDIPATYATLYADGMDLARAALNVWARNGGQENGEVNLQQNTSDTVLELNHIDYLRLMPTDVDPDYEDGYIKLYYLSSGATQELRVRGKSGATETQVTLANITP